MANVQFYLHVCSHSCDCEPPPETSISVFGNNYAMNFRGKVDINYSIENNKLRFAIPEYGHKPSLGDADHIESVIIRICDSAVTVQAIYDEAERTGLAACCNNGSGCGCYASGGCEC